nr:DUF5753 domain-containing protein [Spiractinospora alimapuensis]
MQVAPPTVSSWETGRREPDRNTVDRLDSVLSTGGALGQIVVSARAPREIPESWRDFAQLERQAVEIRDYQTGLIPGLLQTRSYIQSLMRNIQAETGADDLKRFEDDRVARLDQVPQTSLTFVVDELAVRRVLGSSQVMREQIEWILELIELQRIRFSVVPMNSPTCPIPTGPFRIMSLYNGQLVGHAEHWGGIAVVSEAVRVNMMLRLFGNLQSEALSASSSTKLLHEIKTGLS